MIDFPHSQFTPEVNKSLITVYREMAKYELERYIRKGEDPAIAEEKAMEDLRLLERVIDAKNRGEEGYEMKTRYKN